MLTGFFHLCEITIPAIRKVGKKRYIFNVLCIILNRYKKAATSQLIVDRHIGRSTILGTNWPRAKGIIKPKKISHVSGFKQ